MNSQTYNKYRSIFIFTTKCELKILSKNFKNSNEKFFSSMFRGSNCNVCGYYHFSNENMFKKKQKY